MRLRLCGVGLFCAFLSLLPPGCDSYVRPIPPGPFQSSATFRSQTVYTRDQFQKDLGDYRAQIDSGDVLKARITRNEIIHRFRVDIDFEYREFQNRLYQGRAELNVAADMTELGVSAATAVVGGETAKSLLAAGLTAFKGSRLSIDKNFFREKTTEILLNKMDAARDKKDKEILLKLELPVSVYPFDEAWDDLVQLYAAGSLYGALQSLAAEAGQEAAVAQTQKAAAAEGRVKELRERFIQDEFQPLLREFWKPAGQVNPDAEDAILRWAEGHGLRLQKFEIPLFINSPMYRGFREQAAQDLGLLRSPAAPAITPATLPGAPVLAPSAPAGGPQSPGQ